ncbi:calcium-binding protein [Streptomyces sp. CA-146814]|uniref:calcium-binding protein n=1 Tax=Streptomyces sp. CA-146814 TaxID=3240053 RepID=UPI003D8ECD53
MRIRATVAGVSGAIVLSALAVPAAQADDGRSWTLEPGFKAVLPTVGDTSKQASDETATSDDPKIISSVVNAGKPIVIGTKVKKTVSFSATATAGAFFGGVRDVATFIWVGGSIDDEDTFGFRPDAKSITCKAVDAVTTTCNGTITLDPAQMINSHATSWHVGAYAMTGHTDEFVEFSASRVRVQSFSQLTVNASPEPVKKGKIITITGKLTRANWDTGTYKGYVNQSVQLQFKKKGAKSYTTVRTVKTGSNGILKTTVKATVDGAWRYSFAGKSNTAAVSSAGDYVDVK